MVRESPTKGKSLELSVAIILACVICTPLASASSVGIEPLAAGSGTITCGRTILLPFESGVRSSQVWNATCRLPASASYSNAELSVATPSPDSNPILNPAIVSSVNGNNIWTWPGPYGGYTSSSRSLSVDANNSSYAGGIVLPPGSTLSGAAVASTLAGTVGGSYSFNLTVGSQTVLNRSGATAYGPEVPLSWSQRSEGISSFASGSEPDGSSLFVMGESGGNVTIMSVDPGTPGRVIYSLALTPGLPVTSVAVGSLFIGASLSVAATAGDDVFVLTPVNSTWSETVLLPPNASTVTPIYSGIQLLRYPNGLPAVVVADNSRGLFLSNWTIRGGTGTWANPMVPILKLQQNQAIHLGASSGAGVSKVAVAQASHILVINFTGLSASESYFHNISSNDSVTSIALDPSGRFLAFGTESGQIFVADLESVSPPTQVFSGTMPVYSLANFANPVRSLLGAVLGSNTIVSILQPWSSPKVVTETSGAAGNTFDTISFAAVSDATGDDIIVSTPFLLDSFNAEFTFNSTGLENWVSSFENSLNLTPPQFTPSGNPFVRVPITLSTRNIAVHLEPAYLYYNASQAVSLGKQGSLSKLSGGDVFSLALSVSGDSGGQIYLVLAVGYVFPPAPGSAGWFVGGIENMFLAFWKIAPWVAAVLVATALAIILVAHLKSWQTAHLARRSHDHDKSAISDKRVYK